mmetsp:Transcript_7861/g.16707  ORF Transcript_7861/g.16707 Transcript_7861/m.16707 type:complete len:303 (-) Transcript_7861:58-966(-)
MTSETNTAASTPETPALPPPPSKPLRICCYGSSSSRTPKKYTDAAYRLGRFLALRNHTCVNGAGSAGCMAAMNRGANDADGKIVGVIHEMFVVDGSDWFTGSSEVFGKEAKRKHEILVARGKDLQERKRLLVEGADALVVMPGGPGTWDELWEMACARHLGLTSIPIVCVNVDGYYDTFMTILMRADEDQLLYKKPHDIVHFEETPEAAVLWIENHISEFKKEAEQRHPIKKRTSAIRKMDSNVSGSTLSVWGRMSSFLGDEPALVSQKKDVDGSKVLRYAVVFAAGMSLGLLVANNRSGSK